MNDTKPNHSTSILTLGDGDFTYSLDLARYLAVSTEATIRLIATGIDTKEELLSKYRDTPHILDQLDCAKSPRLSISIKHSVNAILPPENDDKVKGAKIAKVDHVIFNHPHLGTEDAALHGRFLCHFFHSCVHGWLHPSMGALIHLTLVDGQYERWNCVQAAKRQGLVLLQREPFMPPPVDNPSYHYRRHQSGRSFESRRPNGSETFVFAPEKNRNVDLSLCILSWTTMAPFMAPTETEAFKNGAKLPTVLACPHCDRVFKEERSRQCHVRDKHPNGSEKKMKTEGTLSFQCELCNNVSQKPRTFDNEQGLQDHIRAKHSAIHKTILPDWCHDVQNESSSEEKPADVRNPSQCVICGATITIKENELTHLEDFRPLPVAAGISGDKFRCQFCGKSFQETRAKLQHENFCKDRQ